MFYLLNMKNYECVMHRNDIWISSFFPVELVFQLRYYFLYQRTHVVPDTYGQQTI